jgi:hypothetical protein
MLMQSIKENGIIAYAKQESQTKMKQYNDKQLELLITLTNINRGFTKILRNSRDFSGSMHLGYAKRTPTKLIFNKLILT